LGKKPLIKRLKNSLIYLGAVCAYKIAQTIPRKLGLMLFGAVGAIAFIFPNREKSRTIQHLKLIFGNSWSESEILKTARNVYIELGKNLFDGIHLHGLSKDKLGKVINYDSFDDFRDAYNKGKGVIAISAHIGCFEMLPHYYAYKGFSSFTIGRRLYDERLELLIRRVRNGKSTEYLDCSPMTKRNPGRAMAKENWLRLSRFDPTC
jgi:KDO2-lipid IV(A) lauroyltransferase